MREDAVKIELLKALRLALPLLEASTGDVWVEALSAAREAIAKAERHECDFDHYGTCEVCGRHYTTRDDEDCKTAKGS